MDYVGDYKSTETDGWVSSNSILDTIVGTACTAGLRAGIKQQCSCPNTVTLRGPNNSEWSVTAPETIVGWSFAVLGFVVILAMIFWPALLKAYRRARHPTSSPVSCARCMAGDAAEKRKQKTSIFIELAGYVKLILKICKTKTYS